MIAANKGGLFGAVLDGYIRRKVRGAFNALHVRGELPSSETPLLVYANHGNFWDAFVAHQLCKAAGWDGYALMDEQNLRRYRFLSRIGAFSIRKGEAGSSLESLRYCKGLLRRPGAAVFIFPEGEHRPFGQLPLRLERGIEVVARATGARCLPVALRYCFFERERPEVLIDVGTPHGPAPLQVFQENLEAVVQRVAAAVNDEGFRPLVAGARGVRERWDAVRGLSPDGGRAP
jgi:1-acyl-sn-glycerol-3-phosphate acyltransferase